MKTTDHNDIQFADRVCVYALGFRTSFPTTRCCLARRRGEPGPMPHLSLRLAPGRRGDRLGGSERVPGGPTPSHVGLRARGVKPD